ncbi:MAG: hypothetical protein J07HQX50_01247 [Haloquadratum sp. J07HQX50]|nr:MAG: hypothetical protein J07HQX50_01247 [Haloquadratum sp. J07HQX50]
MQAKSIRSAVGWVSRRLRLSTSKHSSYSPRYLNEKTARVPHCGKIQNEGDRDDSAENVRLSYLYRHQTRDDEGHPGRAPDQRDIEFDGPSEPSASTEGQNGSPH